MEWVVPGYRHTRELGSGASGRVVLALHDETGTAVAIKYLGEELRADSDFLEEFRAEARLLGDLETPYVVRLWEYVEGPEGAAIVMELVDGIALRALLREAGATGPEAALVVLKGSLLGLAAAHAMGVVHRDYKPENVLVAADGSSKLVDFGIAVKTGDDGGIAGTPPYMAPEQWTGDPATAAADVYAATATFFECLTGKRPYPGTEFAELVVQHTTAPIPDEEAPEAVRPLIRRGLAKTADERPSSAAAFVAELEAVAGVAYGEDWEEKGQRKLAAMAALLPLLFPSAGGVAADGGTALATTVLGAGAGAGAGVGKGVGKRLIPKRVLVGGLAGAVVLGLLGGGYASGVVGNGTTHTKPVAGPTPAATTSFTPSGTPTPIATPSDTATVTPTPTASATPTAAPTTSPAGPAPTVPVTDPTTKAPTKAPTTSPTPKPTVATATVPDLNGLSTGAAQSALVRAGFDKANISYTLAQVCDAAAPAGVYQQSLRAGSSVPRTSKVSFSSRTYACVAYPGLVEGRRVTLAVVQQELKDDGFSNVLVGSTLCKTSSYLWYQTPDDPGFLWSNDTITLHCQEEQVIG
ncbi:protein kinase domain-containing protein [Streptacidiphilus cavernicola]|uniref:Protein kinase n=1 Tax=Streptacidiphilus cavernicola TaxID=3342716 RepID=A0ABV6VNP3_9ACTN